MHSGFTPHARQNTSICQAGTLSQVSFREMRAAVVSERPEATQNSIIAARVLEPFRLPNTNATNGGHASTASRKLWFILRAIFFLPFRDVVLLDFRHDLR